MPDAAVFDTEWLEADGQGGFASGTVSLCRSRRYHALLLAGATPPTGRMVLVNGFDAWIETPQGRCDLSTQRYLPDVVYPAGFQRLESFVAEPWPTWIFRLDDVTRIEQQFLAIHGAPRVLIRWRLLDPHGEARLCVRPFLSGRDYHALHHENPAFRFAPERRPGCLVWRPYDGVPAIVARTNGEYRHEPVWYRNFLYQQEQRRGLDCSEDLASPGVFHWDLASGEAVWILEADAGHTAECATDIAQDIESPAAVAARWIEQETQRRGRFASPLARAADAYLVRRGQGQTIIAGYPWFTDWGRDTFIALRGLCIAAGRLDDARDILLAWSGPVSEGMLPNRFPDRGESPEFNSVDASLWFIVAVHDYLAACERCGVNVLDDVRSSLAGAVEAILQGYARGTRYGIRLDDDGLLAAGVPGVQLTWMDAKIGDWVVTPRIGKPVEVQALWLNALWIAGQFSDAWAAHLARGQAAFTARFWNAGRDCLYDVIDCDHRDGTVDAALRPNQIFAVGGLPLPLLSGQQARQVVDVVERELWTPLGLRSLASAEPGYCGHYEGDSAHRDGAYHQGTVWPWLIGPFVDAWLRVRDNTLAARREARERFVAPLTEHLKVAGLGHVSEIADGDLPPAPRGCPFQAWSLGELMRAQAMVNE